MDFFCSFCKKTYLCKKKSVHYICGKSGHLIYDCKSTEGRLTFVQKYANITILYGVENVEYNKFIVNSGATIMMHLLLHKNDYHYLK